MTIRFCLFGRATLQRSDLPTIDLFFKLVLFWRPSSSGDVPYVGFGCYVFASFSRRLGLALILPIFLISPFKGCLVFSERRPPNPKATFRWFSISDKRRPSGSAACL